MNLKNKFINIINKANLNKLAVIFLSFFFIITTLPKTFGQLKSLKELNLSWNKIETLPDSIGSLSSLETLILSKNKLSKIPESFGKLSSLRELWLHENNLESLPESFLELESLKVLQLDGNPLHDNANPVVERILTELKNNNVELD